MNFYKILLLICILLVDQVIGSFIPIKLRPSSKSLPVDKPIKGRT